MRIYRIADVLDVYGKIWQIIESEFPDLEFNLYPSDVENFKSKVRDVVSEIKSRLDFATNDPKRYRLEFTQWEDEFKELNPEERDETGFEREDKE